MLAGDGAGTAPRAVPIVAVAGLPGVGKTAFAVHLAHQLVDRFPDGQLWVDLRGAQRQPLDPAEVLARFLRALGVDGSVVPATLEERAGLYRTLLADRRVLVVLDNAAGEGQVRPLLPGSRGCSVLLTSRAPLAGLEGAHLVDLEVLPAVQAVELLARIVGWQRVAVEPNATDLVVACCGRLPLALRVAGARLASRPQWPVARLAERLADQHRRLDELVVGDLEVRASLALSYQGLDLQLKRLFRRLGLLDAPDVNAWVAAALLDVDLTRADGVMEALVDAHLLDVVGEGPPGWPRYRFHDLVRVFARERAAAEEPAHDQHAALERALDGWLALAERADRRLPGGALWRTPQVQPWSSRWRPDDRFVEALLADPLGWFEAERPSAVAAVAQAAGLGFKELTMALAATLTGCFLLGRHYHDWRRTHQLALAAAHQVGDDHRRAQLLLGLAYAHGEDDNYSETASHTNQALALFRHLGDRRGEAAALNLLGILEIIVHADYGAALDHHRRALDLARGLGERCMEAAALQRIGRVHQARGQFDEALDCLTSALAVWRGVGDWRQEAQTLRAQAMVHRDQGRIERAIACARQAMTVVGEHGDVAGEAFVLQTLGELYLRRGDQQQALDTIGRSLRMFREMSSRHGMMLALRTLGELHHARAHLDQARAHLEEALRLARQLGHQVNMAWTLQSLGKVYAAAGDLEAARTAWQEAVQLVRHVDGPEANQLAQRLAADAL